MRPILTETSWHAPADTSSRGLKPARVAARIGRPFVKSCPARVSGRDHVRGRRPTRRRDAIHLPHWKIRRWPRRGLCPPHPARRRDYDWMSLQRVKDHSSSRVPPAHHGHEGPRRAPRDEKRTPDADEEDGESPVSLRRINR